MKLLIRLFPLLIVLLVACSDDSPGVLNPGGEINDPNKWLVPQNEVLDGGPGKDGIPSVDAPEYSSPEEMVGFISSNDLVLGIVHNGQARAYPHPILDWHEIVNDDIDELSVAITYCPLTGTGIGWDRVVNRGKTEFGVSGLLYNSNLMPYDRATGSTWSQQRLECVNGINVGRTPDLITLVETNYSTWLEAYPDTEILNQNTGFNRPYGQYPYGDYKTNNDRLVFAIDNLDSRLPTKERVLALFVGEEQKAYTFGLGASTEIIADEVNGQRLVIVRSKEKNFIVAFNNDDNLEFEVIADDLPAIMNDNEGNVYDLVGNVIAGPAIGSQLKQTDSFIGYWFSWGTFYPGIELHDQ